MDLLKAPFPYFGGKSRIAGRVWELFGDVKNYVEPFAGSLAVLLARPTAPGIETVNDADGFLANFWRSVSADPEAVAHWADWPVSEIDLHARHSWLVARKDRLAWCLEDPDFYDAKIAGWWVWGMCAWIGGGFCSGEGPWVGDGAHIRDSRQLSHLGDAGRGIKRQRPHLGAGRGISRKRPHLNAGMGINRKLPHLGDAGMGILDYMLALHSRLRSVRVCCGDWERVCGPTPTEKLGLTGVFLDPPYGVEDRAKVYSQDDRTVADRVAEWCLSRGESKKLRIVVCGYEEYNDILGGAGWKRLTWKAVCGYASLRISGENNNRHRETLWASPHCLGSDAELLKEA